MNMVELRLKIVMVALAAFSTACGDLVIKVEKKGKGSSSLSSAQAEKDSNMSEELMTKDLDALRSMALEALIKELKGKDFRTEARSQIRTYRRFLIEQSTRDPNALLLDFDKNSIECNAKGELNMDIQKANKALGIILKTAVLAKLSEESAKALNSKFASEARAIGQLIMKEVGLKIDGDTIVTKSGQTTHTKANVTIKLVPFPDETASVQESDKNEILSMSFERAVGEHTTGTFDADVAVTEKKDGSIIKHVMAIKTLRERSANGLYYQSAEMRLGLDGHAPHYERVTEFDQYKKKKVRVTDSIRIDGDKLNQKTKTFVIDLSQLDRCKLTDDDSGKPTGSDDGDDDDDDSTTGGGKPSNDDDDDDTTVIVVVNPDVNPSNTPTQKK